VFEESSGGFKSLVLLGGSGVARFLEASSLPVLCLAYRMAHGPHSLLIELFPAPSSNHMMAIVTLKIDVG
jgi:hypothetical protein